MNPEVQAIRSEALALLNMALRRIDDLCVIIDRQQKMLIEAGAVPEQKANGQLPVPSGQLPDRQE